MNAHLHACAELRGHTHLGKAADWRAAARPRLGLGLPELWAGLRANPEAPRVGGPGSRRRQGGMVERQEAAWGPGSAGIRGAAVGFPDGFGAGGLELGRQNLLRHQPTPWLGFFSGCVS